MTKYNPTQFELPLDNVVNVPLSKGQIAIIDIEDIDLLNIRWHARFQPTYANGGQYVAVHTFRENGRVKDCLLHRAVLSRIIGKELSTHDICDHINGDTLDNRRINLRLCTATENKRNISRGKRNTSGYKGVSWYRRYGKWVAHIRENGKKKFLGYFDNLEDAYSAYCKATKENYGEFARLE